MKFVLIGPGQLGQLLLCAAGPDCLIIGRDAARTRQVGELFGCPYTTDLSRAAEGDGIAVAVPAEAVGAVLTAMPVRPGAVVLNFATAAAIPDDLRARRPDVRWSEAKLVGSAVGMAHGLRGAIVLSESDAGLLRRVRALLPGLADDILPAQPVPAPVINAAATRAALCAATALERELRALHTPQPLLDAALGCTLPGVILSYQRGTLGGFASALARELRP